MINQAQADELKALIRVARTRTVRYYLTVKGQGGPEETVQGTEAAMDTARSAVEDYIGSITEKEVK